MLRKLEYYARVGIIDSFKLTMDETELAIRLTDNNEPFFDNEGNLIESYYSIDTMNSIKRIEEKVMEIIFEEENEYPHIIRYFPIPNPDYCDFDVCVVAKISNNGSTYIFSPHKGYLEVMVYEYGTIKDI